ncbi:hypothetical protein GQ54DRAFT_309313 [Martensiomyces pterosporus]|nr:hypothetical protein GQ54DRAFT_309313 [Martensiomyces pterosporus]
MGGFHHGFGYAHHCHGRLRNKIIFFGVTLWLTSTVIAGVRRATGWTHNAHSRLPPTPSERAERDERRKEMKKMVDERLQESLKFADERMRWLEQQYGDTIADEATREQWRQRVAVEQSRLADYWARSSQWITQNMERAQQTDAYKRHCHQNGGFMNWYLGVGERTFDWFARKLASSRHFHWEDPATSYESLSVRQQQHSVAASQPYSQFPVPPPGPSAPSAPSAPPAAGPFSAAAPPPPPPPFVFGQYPGSAPYIATAAAQHPSPATTSEPTPAPPKDSK